MDLGDFVQRLEFGTPRRWSKYTTRRTLNHGSSDGRAGGS